MDWVKYKPSSLSTSKLIYASLSKDKKYLYPGNLDNISL